MKNKIGFMALSIITVLATLGIGFSMWSQTITISGTVHTGNVSISVSNYTGTYAWKDLDEATDNESNVGLSPYNGLEFFQGAGWLGNEIKSPDQPEANFTAVAFTGVNPDYVNSATEDHQLVGLAEVVSVNSNAPTTTPVVCTNNSGITMVVHYDNLFPVVNPAGGFFNWCADFDISNAGSIPVKFHLPTASQTVTGNTPTPIVTYKDAAGAVIALEGAQIEPGQTVHAMICIPVNEQTVQSGSGSFTITIVAQQWNEYPGT
jgi:hypothetical protein